MAVLWILLGIVAGACIAVQAPINAQLGRDLAVPFAAAFVSFAAGAVLLGLMTVVWSTWGPVSVQWSAPAPWLFVAGGALGAFYVTTVLVLTSHIGAAAVMGLAVAGQLLAGLVVDRVGLLGLAVREITLGRVAGALLLVTGAVMIRVL